MNQKDIFEQHRITNPQVVIDDLLAQTTRQAKEIHELNKKLNELSGSKKKK